jgi:CheY-like chemotaxis protein
VTRMDVMTELVDASSLRLLLVEDDPLQVTLTRRALELAGVAHTLEVAVDGATALEQLASGDLPDLVLLDLRLPGMTGHEVLREIRTQPATRRLPVLMLTSSREPADVALAYDEGANAYLVKPADLSEFRELGRAIATFWGQFVERPV